MEIGGSTRLIGLMGNPVEHTLSPVIHNGISRALGIPSVYVPFKVEKEGIGSAVKGAYELNILGLNVTVPHKNDVMAHLARVDEAAKNIGAVNTLVRDELNHGYVGYNTDMPGLLRQITEDGISLKGRTVVVLGAGGASKAVVYMCLSEGAARIYLLNRTVEKACIIAEEMNGLLNNAIDEKLSDNVYKDNGKETVQLKKVIPMSINDYDDISEDNLIVFQATSIGLMPNVDDVVIEDPTFYKKIEVGIDLIYNPANTRFMQLVTANGGKAYNALKMLLYQGVKAYELWHNIEVPDEVIKDVYVELKRKVYKKDNIVLIGFMGSGKSTVGRALAKELNMDFLDTDEYIEKHAGMTISEIFDKMGEEKFRKMETETLMKLCDGLTKTVVSTGGGMPLRVENSRLLKELGRVFYLSAANSIIYDRVKEDTKRPLLQDADPLAKICRMMKERGPLYESACDVKVDTNSNVLDEVVGYIISCVQE